MSNTDFIPASFPVFAVFVDKTDGFALKHELVIGWTATGEAVFGRFPTKSEGALLGFEVPSGFLSTAKRFWPRHVWDTWKTQHGKIETAAPPPAKVKTRKK